MAVKIRLKRMGTKKRPFYRVVVMDARTPRDGGAKEEIGFYDPMLPQGHERRLKIDSDRLAYWVSVGAQMTDRVAWFVKKGFVQIAQA